MPSQKKKRHERSPAPDDKRVHELIDHRHQDVAGGVGALEQA